MLMQEGSVPIQEIKLRALSNTNTRLWMKREDMLSEEIPGNKWWKLKYNLEKAKREGCDTLLSFGGAYSNHIDALATAGRIYGFKTIGIIRGEEEKELNYMLKKAKANGMHLKFVERSEYRMKGEVDFLEKLKEEFGEFYAIPEGGSNAEAVRGCKNMLNEETRRFDVICSAVGTGGTLAGLVVGKEEHQMVLGISALKGMNSMKEDVDVLIKSYDKDFTPCNFIIENDHHCGGYAKISEELLDFTRSFYAETKIKLDLIYTAKMAMAVVEMIKNGRWEGKEILLIHTGGLQGNEGMMKRYGLNSIY